MNFKQIMESRAMRIAAVTVMAIVLASEFTVIFGPIDLLLHGAIAILGIILTIAFALKKTWAEKPFPTLCGYYAVKCSILPAIHTVAGSLVSNYPHPLFFTFVFFCIGVWLWICFMVYSRGARVKNLVVSIAGVTIIYALEFLLLSPKGTLRGLPGTVHIGDARAWTLQGNQIAGFLSTELKIQESESEELLMRAPTFSWLLYMPIMIQQEKTQRDLSKEEVTQALRGLNFWDELHELWHKGSEANQSTIEAHAVDVEQFARNVFYRNFYWLEANKLLKQGSLSKQEIDTRAKQVADRQVREILKQTSKQIW